MANSINATSTGNGGIITTGDDSGVLNIQTNETTAISIDASQSVDFTNNIDAPNTFGFKNRLINGGMVIDQRNAGASVTQTTSGLYTLDRWKTYGTVASKFTVQQNAGSVTPPAGFVNYLGVTSSSAYSVGASDEFILYQLIEGLNVADLDFGKSTAKSVTLSFWVRSSLTGTFGGALRNESSTRSYPYSYTISSANTWEQKTITIAGDTSGTWLTTTGVGLEVTFGLGQGASTSGTAGSWAASGATNATGATSVVGTNGATFYVTGVQLEKGTQATSFDFRSYGTELALCQRYYQQIGAGNAIPLGVACMSNASRADLTIPLKVTMRTSPSITSASGSNYFNMYKNGDTFFTSFNQGDMNTYIVNIRPNSISGTAGVAGYMVTNNASAYIGISAEL